MKLSENYHQQKNEFPIFMKINERMTIQKLACIIGIIFLILYCGHKRSDVKRTFENGVEVIFNHLEPYKIKGEPTSLQLEEQFTIDTERDEIAEIGVTNIEDFDIDSQGNIYFFQKRESDEKLVYKFDKNANFLTIFGKRGQGPGEIEYPLYQYITQKDEILIQDGNRSMLFFFDSNGTLIKETRLDSESAYNLSLFPLENGNFLSLRFYFNRSTKHRWDLLFLLNSKFEKLKELGKCDYGKPIAFTQQKVKYTPRVFIYQVFDKRVYVGHENMGYEILVYDLDGNLVKKIRKEYNPVDVPNEFKEFWRANSGPYKNRLAFPDKMPSFHYFFLDDEGRLYIKTYEKGDKQNEYMHDIFNSDGIFIARKSIVGYGGWVYPGNTMNRAKVNNHRLYCIREKESSFKELLIYKMTWQ